MTTWAAILVLGFITFCYRYSFVSAYGRRLAGRIPREFLELLAPATFSAIIAGHLMSHRNDPSGFPPLLVTAALSMGVAYATRSMLVTLVFGLGVLAVLQGFWVGA